MINVIIIHGAYGYPDENWFGWLKNQLLQLNIPCTVPQFPTPENQHIDHWLNHFNKNYFHLITSKTILIGHSLGAAFILRWLETTQKSIFKTILAGAFIGKVGIEKFDMINQNFFEKPFDWELIKNHSEEFICYHGDNDPYVSLNDFHHIADNLQAKKILISNGGHLNAKAGYVTFPQLLNYLLLSLSSTVAVSSLSPCGGVVE